MARGDERRQDVESDTGADTLHRLQQLEPLALFAGDKAEQPDGIVADPHLDQQHRRLTRRQLAQGGGRALHQIADAMDIEDDVVLGHRIDCAFQFSDHCSAAMIRALVPASAA
jgi:hypothetical protein